MVYSVLRALAGVVGDAYVQLRSPVPRVAFEQATLRALRWLRPQCRRLAVVAHSQGAAIAHRTLQRSDAPRAELLITVGSGITKLEALRYFERLGASDRIAALLAPPFLLLAAVVWLRTRALGLNDAEVLGGVSVRGHVSDLGPGIDAARLSGATPSRRRWGPGAGNLPPGPPAAYCRSSSCRKAPARVANCGPPPSSSAVVMQFMYSSTARAD
jgi:hypothetical protein